MYELQLKKEFFKKYGITDFAWEKRKSDLLMWLSNFFDYEIIETAHPIKIRIYEQFGEYKPLPRKIEETNREEKLKDYADFTFDSLTDEFKPNSKARVARDAICEFGEDKYMHTDYKSVSRRFVTPAFNKYGESREPRIWVWYSTYTIPDPKVVEEWRHILSKWKIGEKEAAAAFYAQEEGEDIMDKKEKFVKAKQEFSEKYRDILVLVLEWKRKDGVTKE